MRRLIVILSALSLAAIVAFAGTHRPADYPLRIHVFEVNWHSHYRYSNLESVDGEGRANLYENGAPHAFDFAYTMCSQRFRGNMGYETYMARWKKTGRELEVLLPVMGKPGQTDACELKIVMKDTAAYFRRNGLLGEEPASVFKDWMAKHEYDPEHGKDLPVNLPGPPSPPAAPPAR